jgi:hypothetical protein
MTDVLTSIQRILDKPDDEDCDGLLRDALRLSLLQHPDMEEDDQDTLYDCIWTLIGRYIESPEGEGEDAQILMTRLLWVVFPVLKPHAPRGSNERQDETHAVRAHGVVGGVICRESYSKKRTGLCWVSSSKRNGNFRFDLK